jgi:hypothetical protein
MVEVSWIAIILATLSTMIVGTIWYAKPVFGKAWQSYIGKTDKDMEKVGWLPIPVTVVVSFITAFVLAHVTFLSYEFFDYSWMQTALTTGFWLWLGFTAARVITHDMFEGRRKKLTLLTLGHELVTVMVMALIIGLFPL